MATEILRPSDVGDVTNIENQYPVEGEHWDKVDEVDADGDSTRVYNSSDVSYYDVYKLQNTSIPDGSTVNSIKVYFCIQSWTASTYGYGVLRLAGNETEGSNILCPTAYTTYGQTLVRPGGGDWAVSDINNLQAGVGLRNLAGFATTVNCTQVYVEVDYTPPPPAANPLIGKPLIAPDIIKRAKIR